MKFPRLITVITAFTLACSLTALPSEADAGVDLAQHARRLLENKCYSCHGDGGTDEGGFNYVLNHERMVSTGKVKPGDSTRSKLFRVCKTGEMPMDEEPLSKAELEVLKDWIDDGADSFDDDAEVREEITPQHVLQLIAEDLETDTRQSTYWRYFTLTHLYNAGVPENELETYRHGLSKLVNSLSWGKRVVKPKAIDDNKTVLRIDLRDYRWTIEQWNVISAFSPYCTFYECIGGAYAYAKLESAPSLRADWFVHAASRPPLYHMVLGIPTTDAELEKMIGVDVERNLDEERAVRAGFARSGVSASNRLIERHDSMYGSYWKSYDFGSDRGRANLFAHPLGPGEAESMFAHDGGEMIFSLPNGLHGFMLTDAAGNRIDRGPTEIVSDPKSADRSVVNGISCMSCHARGMIMKDDEIRDHVVRFKHSFNGQANDILALYPGSDEVLDLLEGDRDAYLRAQARTGAPDSKTDVVTSLSLRFEEDLDLRQATAEAALAEDEFTALLQSQPELARRLGPLLGGRMVSRDIFDACYPLIVEYYEDRLTMHQALGGEGIDVETALAATAAERTGQMPVSTTAPVETSDLADWVKVGHRILGKDATDGKWYLAEIMDISNDGQAHVHWVGYPRAQDVWLAADSMKQLLQTHWERYGQWIIHRPSQPAKIDGVPYDDRMTVWKGDAVHIRSNGHWWPAFVIEQYDDGRVKVQYASRAVGFVSTTRMSQLRMAPLPSIDP